MEWFVDLIGNEKLINIVPFLFLVFYTTPARKPSLFRGWVVHGVGC